MGFADDLERAAAMEQERDRRSSALRDARYAEYSRNLQSVKTYCLDFQQELIKRQARQQTLVVISAEERRPRLGRSWLKFEVVRTLRGWPVGYFFFTEDKIYLPYGHRLGNRKQVESESVLTLVGHERARYHQGDHDGTSESFQRSLRKAGVEPDIAADAVYFWSDFRLDQVDWAESFYDPASPRPEGKWHPLSFDQAGKCCIGDYRKNELGVTYLQDVLIQYLKSRTSVPG